MISHPRPTIPPNPYLVLHFILPRNRLMQMCCKNCRLGVSKLCRRSKLRISGSNMLTGISIPPLYYFYYHVTVDLRKVLLSQEDISINFGWARRVGNESEHDSAPVPIFYFRAHSSKQGYRTPNQTAGAYWLKIRL